MELRRPSTEQELRSIHHAPITSRGQLPKHRLRQEPSPMHDLIIELREQEQELERYEAQKEFIELLMNPETAADIDEDFLDGFLDVYEIDQEDKELFLPHLEKSSKELQENLTLIQGQIAITKEEVQFLTIKKELLSFSLRLHPTKKQEEPKQYEELLLQQQETQIQFAIISIQRELTKVYEDIGDEEQQVANYTEKRNNKRALITKYNKTIHRKHTKEQQTFYDITMPELTKEVHSYEQKIKQLQEHINTLKQIPKVLIQKDADLAFLDEVQSHIFSILEFNESCLDHLLAVTPIVTKEDIIPNRYEPWIEMLTEQLTELLHYIRSLLPEMMQHIQRTPRQSTPLLSISDKRFFLENFRDVEEILKNIYESLQEASWITEQMEFLRETPHILQKQLNNLLEQIQEETRHIIPHL